MVHLLRVRNIRRFAGDLARSNERAAANAIEPRPVLRARLETHRRVDKQCAAVPQENFEALAVLPREMLALRHDRLGLMSLVERDAARFSGAWLFRGTRVPVSALFENLEDGVCQPVSSIYSLESRWNRCERCSSMPRDRRAHPGLSADTVRLGMASCLMRLVPGSRPFVTADSALRHQQNPGWATHRHRLPAFYNLGPEFSVSVSPSRRQLRPVRPAPTSRYEFHDDD